MAKYVSEERLLKLREHFDKDYSIVEAKVIQGLLNECRELNHWMTLEEFLKSGFVGACWVYTDSECVYTAYYAEDGQLYESDLTEYILDRNNIVRVMPIHKPEPPRC